MGRKERIALLDKIEKVRSSKVIAFLTGDRRGLETKIASDMVPMFYEILVQAGPKEKIDLFLYSQGGDGITAMELVSLIREYCSTFHVLIPHRAHSAATLITLGANSIYMNKGASLSPVDVSLSTPFNPPAPAPENLPIPPKFLPVNVEDLYGYVNFVKNEIGLKSGEEMTSALEFLTEQLSPLAIGALHRAREKNKAIAESLLKNHMNDEKIIQDISNTLTRGLYIHAFAVNRTDAQNMMLPVEEANPELETLIWELYKEYSSLMQLKEPFNPATELEVNEDEKEVQFHRAVLETLKPLGGNEIDPLLSYTFVTVTKISRLKAPPQLAPLIPPVQSQEIDNRWALNFEV